MDALNSSFALNFEYLGLCIGLDEKVLFTAWVIVYVLCSSIFVLTFYVAFQKWKKQRSGNLSHSDVFTFNIVAVEMIAFIGSVMTLISFHTKVSGKIWLVGTNLFQVSAFVQIVFHTFICVDRYLAVVHPVVYLGLKKQSSVTHRNIGIALVWMLCIGHTIAIFLVEMYFAITGLLIPSVSAIVICYCTITVLCALLRPKPGDMGKVKSRLDQSKRVAFCTILLVLVTLLMKFIIELISFLITVSKVMDEDLCFLSVISLWFGLPSKMVLPLLFLHRAGAVKVCMKRVRRGLSQ